MVFFWGPTPLIKGVGPQRKPLIIQTAVVPTEGIQIWECFCSYMAGHYPGILMTGHIGTNTQICTPSLGTAAVWPYSNGLGGFGARWNKGVWAITVMNCPQKGNRKFTPTSFCRVGRDISQSRCWTTSAVRRATRTVVLSNPKPSQHPTTDSAARSENKCHYTQMITEPNFIIFKIFSVIPALWLPNRIVEPEALQSGFGVN